MGKHFKIELEANDLGQVLDGLRCRAEAWRNTASYLLTGESPEVGFMPEECRDAEEAGSIAADYERIIGEMVRQRDEQKGEAYLDASRRVGTKRSRASALQKEGTVTQSGYAIFIDTMCEGRVALWRDGEGRPVFYGTREEAEREIVDDLMTRLQEYLEGGREFEDAITVEEYILRVERLADGAVVTEEGGCFH